MSKPWPWQGGPRGPISIARGDFPIANWILLGVDKSPLKILKISEVLQMQSILQDRDPEKDIPSFGVGCPFLKKRNEKFSNSQPTNQQKPTSGAKPTTSQCSFGDLVL